MISSEKSSIFRHECRSCSLAELWFEANDAKIFMNLNRVATEGDLERDHLLESVGQTIETVQIEIAFCPYCGSKLADSEPVVVPSFHHCSIGGKN